MAGRPIPFFTSRPRSDWRPCACPCLSRSCRASWFPICSNMGCMWPATISDGSGGCMRSTMPTALDATTAGRGGHLTPRLANAARKSKQCFIRQAIFIMNRFRNVYIPPPCLRPPEGKGGPPDPGANPAPQRTETALIWANTCLPGARPSSAADLSET